MRIYIARDYQDLSRKAANIISAQVIMKPDCVLGLATGSSPIGAYKQLVEWYEKGDLDFSEVRTVNLDEYKGLTGDNKESYRYFMNTNLFDHVNIDKANTNVPNGMAKNVEAECRRYNELIRSLGGIDLQLLGIGRNGHIGFNEPEEAFEKETHVVALTQSTIDANSRLFDDPDDVPRYALTMGIKSIMQARRVLLIASGEDKADAIHKSLFGPVTPQVPASILQMHNNLTVVADKAALSACGRELDEAAGKEGFYVNL
ncbi:MAG: glucosamine-6-phosphate deaminase [Lachnospiraceae bacterium]|jgi:glucosamine-6-phosphate deaminase|nr:glucosamine-6-phosphate deaminase [Lachnospiraceae bacterium]MCH4029869.1 glucosamine-6-phosphate deaminase [Lachnospiraceae bacterium]MCH4071339.1 glucosamine-6-phosphate deaminase [Lachnospiraceae bacterium]MCH4109386.1 glucosamine-6-phosphate deaminase [Lachnospiraceae bacterium]MCI1303118.1 glucosamine-6-phosphate deaminase [Lachnospiraceae bacterium]